MVTMIEIEDAMSTYVKPQTYPLAIKMLSGEDEIPQDAKMPLRDFGVPLAFARPWLWVARRV